MFICIRATPNAYYQINERLHTFFLLKPPHGSCYGKMKIETMKNEKYIAPEAEVLEIAVEQGFATSGSGGQEEIGGSKEEGEW